MEDRTTAKPRLFVTGDTHGPEGYIRRFRKESFPEQKTLSREDVVLLAGDFGAVWDADKRYMPPDCQYLKYSGETHRKDLPHGESEMEKDCLDWLAEKPFTVAAVPGNHENYDRLYKAYPLVPFGGGAARKIRDNVYYLERGQVYTLAGRTVFAFGGARSHDISGGILRPSKCGNWEDFRKALQEKKAGYFPYRVEHVSWWEEEMPDQADMDRGLKTLDENGWSVDLVLTHEMPDLVVKECGFNPDGLSQYLGDIERKLSYRFWIGGHYHFNSEFNTKQKWVLAHEGEEAAKACPSLEYILYEQILEVPPQTP